MDLLEVEVDVSENYIDRVHPGGEASTRLDAYPDWNIPGTVIAIIPTADEQGNRQGSHRHHAKDARILPQMGARVAFLGLPGTASASHAVRVPPDAVKAKGDTGTVYRVTGDNSVEELQVRLWCEGSRHNHLLSGIAPGDRLAAGNLSHLKDGAKIKPLVADTPAFPGNVKPAEYGVARL